MTDVEKTVPITELVPDSENNANRGTPRGRKMLKNSLKRLGAGRSLLLDKNNVILGGNKTWEEAKRQGFKHVKIVETDGDTIIAVRRTDLDAKTKKAKELAIADNRVAEVDLLWNPEILSHTEVDLSELFEPIELDRLQPANKSRKPEPIDLQPPPKMLWVLLGIPFNRFDVVQANLAALEQEAEISVQTARDK